ncbi:type II secretion system protein [Planctomycetota bacterium]
MKPERAKAFTLVEILVVVALLGILAAIVIPAVASSGNSAREAALKQDMNLLQRFILIYTCHHLEIAPGYANGNSSLNPTEAVFQAQALMATNQVGATAAIGTNGYNRGPYLQKIPVNPVNQMSTILMLANGNDFPANADGTTGWIYSAEKQEIRPNCTGMDTNGNAYYDY